MRSMNIIKLFMPPIIVELYRRMRKQSVLYYHGDYFTWETAEEAAESVSGEYDRPNILNAEIEATKKVRDGEAAWAQDGMAFLEKEPHFEILSSLLYASNRSGGIFRSLIMAEL